MSYWKARLSGRACEFITPTLRVPRILTLLRGGQGVGEGSPLLRNPPYFTPGLPGIFCLHNIYPTADTKSNGAWVPGGERPNEPTRSGTKGEAVPPNPSTSWVASLRWTTHRGEGEAAGGSARAINSSVTAELSSSRKYECEYPGTRTTRSFLNEEGKRGEREREESGDEGVAGTGLNADKRPRPFSVSSTRLGFDLSVKLLRRPSDAIYAGVRPLPPSSSFSPTLFTADHSDLRAKRIARTFIHRRSKRKFPRRILRE